MVDGINIGQGACIYVSEEKTSSALGFQVQIDILKHWLQY